MAGQHSGIDQENTVAEPHTDSAGDLRRMTDNEAGGAEALQQRGDLWFGIIAKRRIPSIPERAIAGE
jgi:hypothetical protein